MTTLKDMQQYREDFKAEYHKLNARGITGDEWNQHMMAWVCSLIVLCKLRYYRDGTSPYDDHAYDLMEKDLYYYMGNDANNNEKKIKHELHNVVGHNQEMFDKYYLKYKIYE